MLFGPDCVGGPIPFQTTLIDRKRLAPEVLRNTWAAVSLELWRGCPLGRLYAEKIVGSVDLVVRAGIPLKVIDLIRDPRDIFCSIRALTRGGPGFGP